MPNISSTELHALMHDIAIYNSESSYKKMFTALFSTLFSFSYNMLKCREQAEEVASDVMFTLWQKRKELIEVENIKVYALVVTRNLSLNAVKKNATLRVVSLNDLNIAGTRQALNPEEMLIISQNKSKLQLSINALPARCKLVFKLIKEEGLSYKEVGEILNISSKTVDAHLVAAMKKLSEALRTSLYCA